MFLQSWSDLGRIVLIAVLTYPALVLVLRLSRKRTLAKMNAFDAGPTLLVHQGRMLPGAMREQRVTEGEVRQVVRSQGIGSVSQVAAVVLETDGTFSVIPSSQAGNGTALRGVQGFPAGRAAPPCP